MKKIFGVLILFFLFPLAALAASSELSLPNGTVVKPVGAFTKYLIVAGKKRRIADRASFKKLGFTRKDVVNVGRKSFALIPNGESIKLVAYRPKGGFDMHEHFRAGGNMDLYLSVAKELGIEKTVFVPTGNGPDNAGYKEHMAALLKEQLRHPDRIVAFCSVDEADSQAPKIFKDCLDAGGKGLKLMVGHPNFYDVTIDSPVMKELFEIARLRRVPVLLHISIITNPKASQEFKNLLNEFPDVRVQFAHYCSTVYNGVNLEQCAEFLDAYPNLYIDLSMGGGILRYFKYMTESEKDFQEIKDFVLKYQDRIFYGTDVILSGGNSPTQNPKWLRARMMCDFDLHVQAEYRCSVSDKEKKFPLLPGFALPKEVLKKLYIENPKKFLGL